MAAFNRRSPAVASQPVEDSLPPFPRVSSEVSRGRKAETENLQTVENMKTQSSSRKLVRSILCTALPLALVALVLPGCASHTPGLVWRESLAYPAHRPCEPSEQPGLTVQVHGW
jgi:hypothetical protein